MIKKNVWKKLILKTQQRFKSERHNVFTEKINKIALSSNDDKRIKSYEHNPNWPQIPDHPYRRLIIGDSGFGKTNLLFNTINDQSDIDKIYLYAKDPYRAKYQFLIKNREDVGKKHFNDLKAFDSSNIQTIWLILIKTLKIAIQIKNVKY